MFKPNYIFFNNSVDCKVFDSNYIFSKETVVYTHIKSMFPGWKTVRVDTKNQQGFPDMLLLKGDSYLMIEGKRLKKKQLNSIEDDLTYQFGQLAFMKRALTLDLCYMLAVGKGSKIAYIGSKRILTKYL